MSDKIPGIDGGQGWRKQIQLGRLQVTVLVLILGFGGFVGIIIGSSISVLIPSEGRGWQVLDVLSHIIRDLSIAAFVAGILGASYEHWQREGFLSTVMGSLRQILTEEEGVERRLNGIDEKLTHLTPNLTVRRLFGSEDIYREATNFIERSEPRNLYVRATASGNRPVTSNNGTERYKYFETLAQELKSKRQSYYCVVVASGGPNRDERTKFLRMNDVSSNKFLVAQSPKNWDIDIFIVGRKFAIIAFPFVQGEYPDQHELRCAVSIEDRTTDSVDQNIVEELVGWYDSFVLETIAGKKPEQLGP